jgi:superoxide dismutase, Cu-Zn family
MRLHRVVVTGTAALALAVGAMAATNAAGAQGATVTRGEFHPFAVGAGLDIGGHAEMVRSADGRTLVMIHVSGLEPGVSYAAHVHAAPCAVGEADGHYKHDPGGAVTPPNEIWPGPITANAAGLASGRTVAGFEAGPTAVSVVLHRSGPVPNKIACADLA